MATSSQIDITDPERDFVTDPELDSLVHRTLNRIRERLDSDQTSNRSLHSHMSHVSIRAKAEAAKARIRFIDQEAELKKQQALIRIDLETIQEKKDCAGVEAEANAYDEQFLTLDRLERSSISTNDKRERTEHYVAESNLWQQTYSKTGPTISTPKTPKVEQRPNPHVLNPKSETIAPKTPRMKPELDSQTQETTNRQETDTHIFDNVANYLLKKDLIVSRFLRFNDDPANFSNWKSSFCRIVNELKLTCPEQLDFLVNYLGPESSKFASSLRAISSGDPSRGLQMLWARLEERYGSPELIENTLKRKLINFPTLSAKDCKKLYDLYDILLEVGSAMENPVYYSLLSYLNSSAGINPIVAKLPPHLQRKWVDRASKYKVENDAIFPPFTYFLSFVGEVCRISNDPSFSFESISSSKSNFKGQVSAKKTGVQGQDNSNVKNINISSVDGNTLDCPIHLVSSHTLDECREFLKKTFDDKKQFLRDKKMCFKCCRTNSHLAKDCNFNVKCTMCNSTKHPTALHRTQENVPKHGGELDLRTNVNCTEVCGEGFSGRSCAKTLLVNVYPEGQPYNSVSVYAIIDDQSNSTLASPELLDSLGVNGRQISYELASCSGLYQSSGRKVHSLRVCACDKTFDTPLQTVFECNNIPQNHSEIATSAVARQFSHLERIADFLPSSVEDVKIGLLIGRDVIEVHQVREQIVGPRGSPFAQKLGLGWVIIGDVCLGKMHKPATCDFRINTFKTHVFKDNRATIFEPCENNLILKEHVISDQFDSDSIFARTKNDEKVGLSMEDHSFLRIMNTEVCKSDNGHWVAPLPFKDTKPVLPNNRQVALKRALTLDRDLKRNSLKRDHFVTFMSKVLQSGAAEVAQPILDNREVWYLPIFGIYHPHKPNQIRGVFDSSASFKGQSLNSVLLTGPNLTNSLLSILMRFRKNRYAFAADIEQMFYSFLVTENHRDYLRFFWYKDNDPSLELVEYRMTAHVYGNSPSPAIATYCLRKCVEGLSVKDQDVQEFVRRDFYVDDGLKSTPSNTQAVNLLKRTQIILKNEGQLRLHKIVSNSPEVLASFPEADRGKEIKTLRLGEDPLPSLRSLGMWWDLECDGFRFDFLLQQGSNTRRGLLSTLNSIFDPLGLIAPMTLKGKLLFRDIAKNKEWDEELDSQQISQWESWLNSLKSLQTITVPRMCTGQSLDDGSLHELHIFSDASEKAISSVAYVKNFNKYGRMDTGFVFGKCKVAPLHGHTIPRLELCAALLSTQIGQTVLESLDLPITHVKYYTDSKVVLGYLNNRTRRFYNYVSNRVQQILFHSKPDQWFYVPTDNNPADCGTRGCDSLVLLQDKWLSPPSRIMKDVTDVTEIYPLVMPHEDKEVRVETMKSTLTCCIFDRFECFSDWNRLLCAIVCLQEKVFNFKSRNTSQEQKSRIEARNKAERFIIKQQQRQSYSEELCCLEEGKVLPKNSSIKALNPFLDKHGILRLGGRLNKSCLPIEETNPIILPRRGHISLLITRYCHSRVKHQGRIFTEAEIRNSGYWIVGAKRLISSVISSCVQCKKLRGVPSHQLMADLPEDRLTPGPPFTSVGIDTFGPWSVSTRKTRGGAACSKRWALMFTCLTTRAVHIEVIEEMSTSSFINALRRFIAIRGEVKLIRSDRGTNFIGAANCLHLDVINVEDGQLSRYLDNRGITWKFNSPHSSHMGGVWERMIGVTRKILDGILLESNMKNLTHEVLVTFFAEVGAIINSRPIGPISTDPSEPMILSPTSLLTQKVNYESIQFSDLDPKDLYKIHWKQVQILSDMFWKRWRQGYLQSLQQRRKWLSAEPNVKNGDVILLKDKDLPRNQWPVGLVLNAIPSSDGKVRKAEVRIFRNGQCVNYTRPITEMVILLSEN